MKYLLKNNTNTQGAKLIWSISFFYQLGFSSFLNSLSLFLFIQTKKLDDSLSISLGFIALSALTSVAYSFLINKIITHSVIIHMGLFLCTVSMLMLSFTNSLYENYVIAAFSVGSGLCASNLTVLLNREYKHPLQKHHGQHVNYIMLNLGAITGFILFTFVGLLFGYMNYEKLHLISASGMLIAWLLFIFNSSTLRCKKESCGNQFTLFIMLILITIAIFGTIISSHTFMEFLTIVAVASLMVYLYIKYLRSKKHGYLFLFTMFLFAGSTYWLAIAIFHVAIPIIILKHKIWLLPPAAFMVVNPIVILIFGVFFTWLYKRHPFNPFYKFYLGIAATLTSYLFLFLLILNFKQITSCTILLICNIAMTAIAEYCIGTTLKVYVNESGLKSLDFIMMATLRVFRAAAFIFSYILLFKIDKVSSETHFIQNKLTVFIYLISLIILSSLLLYIMNILRREP